MGWVRVAHTSARKAYNSGKGKGHATNRRELTDLEEKLGPIILGIFIGVFVLLFLIALIFG